MQTEILSEWCYFSSNHRSITLVHSMWMYYTKEHSGFLSKRDLHFEIQYEVFLHFHINVRFWDVLVVHIFDDHNILFWSWASNREQFLTKCIISVHTCCSLIIYKHYCASFWHFEHVFGNLSDMYWLTADICIQILKMQTFLEKQKKEQPLKSYSLKEEYLVEILHKNW